MAVRCEGMWHRSACAEARLCLQAYVRIDSLKFAVRRHGIFSL